MDQLKNYFLSIEPFWPKDYAVSETCHEGGVFATKIDWHGMESIKCVPGNGQVGLMLQDQEELQGYFYGTISEGAEIGLNGIERGYFVRFNPGAFFNICNIPATEIDPNGMPMEEILSSDQLARIQEALVDASPTRALVQQFHSWEELRRSGGSHKQLVSYIVEKIWHSQGNLQLHSLEADTAYSGRYLREVVMQGVGLAPKQMCRQVRFQHALKQMERMQRLGRLSFCELACALGYSDQAHFCRDFKTFCGMSPAEYEKSRGLGR